MEGARVEFDESFDERKGKPRAERVTGGTQGEDRGPPAPRDNTCRDFARGNCNRDNCRFSHDGGCGRCDPRGSGCGYGRGWRARRRRARRCHGGCWGRSYLRLSAVRSDD